jgi:hypothetical protein
MLEKIKEISTQVATKASGAVEDLTATVKGSVGSLADHAGSMTETLNEKAVRASTAQMCTVLEIAMEELKSRPLAQQRVSLTATVNIGVASLELQVFQSPGDKPFFRASADGEGALEIREIEIRES